VDVSKVSDLGFDGFWGNLLKLAFEWICAVML